MSMCPAFWGTESTYNYYSGMITRQMVHMVIEKQMKRPEEKQGCVIQKSSNAPGLRIGKHSQYRRKSKNSEKTRLNGAIRRPL